MRRVPALFDACTELHCQRDLTQCLVHANEDFAEFSGGVEHYHSDNMSINEREGAQLRRPAAQSKPFEF